MPSARVKSAIAYLSPDSTDLEALKGLTASELNEVMAALPWLRARDGVQTLYGQRRAEEAEQRVARMFLLSVWSAVIVGIGVAVAGLRLWKQLRP